MINAVVDTNILLRALIKPQGTVGQILQRLRDEDYRLIYSEPLLDELLAKVALRRIREQYGIADQTVEALLALIALRGELVKPEVTVRICRDPHDDMFIAAALAGRAEYVVTGDEDLLTLKRREGIRFVTPRQFLATF